jgi:hypothetical protein
LFGERRAAVDQWQWATCADPEGMLGYLVRRGRVSERKARLFACGCCRRIWPVLNDLARQAVELAERFADGEASEADSRRAEEPLQAFVDGRVWQGNDTWADDAHPYYGVLAAMYAVTYYDDYYHGVLHGAGFVPQQAAFAVGRGDAASTEQRCASEKARQADLVRCVFGSPFRPPRFDPAWRTPAAVALARRAYESRDFAALADLADVIQGAGCEDEELLGHCRGPGPHVRGCWVTDLVLTRE